MLNFKIGSQIYPLAVISVMLLAVPSTLACSLSHTRSNADACKSGFRECRTLALLGDAKAQFDLGLLYHEGKDLDQDFEKAMFWYRKSADQNFALAQYNLGVMYESGQVGKKAPAEAVHWWRRAAERGYALAQINLAGKYYRGDGVEKNYSEAARLWRAAAEQGNAKAGRRARHCHSAVQPRPSLRKWLWRNAGS